MSKSNEIIVVAVDFSEPSYEALREAQRHEPAELHVVHVLPEIDRTGEPAVMWGGAVDNTRRIPAAKDHLAREIEQRGVEGATLHVRVGDPGTEIAAVADAVSATLVVTSTVGRRGLGRLLLGSVAERTARLAPCSVLIVRPVG